MPQQCSYLLVLHGPVLTKTVDLQKQQPCHKNWLIYKHSALFCPIPLHNSSTHTFNCLQGLNIALEHQHRLSSCIPSCRLLLQGANSPYHPSTTSACKCLFYAWHNLPNALAIALSLEATTSSPQSQNTVSTHHHTTYSVNRYQCALAPRSQPMPSRNLSTYRTWLSAYATP